MELGHEKNLPHNTIEITSLPKRTENHASSILYCLDSGKIESSLSDSSVEINFREGEYSEGDSPSIELEEEKLLLNELRNGKNLRKSINRSEIKRFNIGNGSTSFNLKLNLRLRVLQAEAIFEKHQKPIILNLDSREAIAKVINDINLSLREGCLVLTRSNATVAIRLNQYLIEGSALRENIGLISERFTRLYAACISGFISIEYFLNDAESKKKRKKINQAVKGIKQRLQCG